MPTAVRFETPENVQVAYEPAGLGTRFLAWFLDQVLLWVVMVVLLFVLVAVGVSFDAVFDLFEDSENVERAVLYVFGLFALVWGLGSFVYFAACELLLRGQTVGKRASNIRVVKAGGFQLDAASILIRNMFRVADHIPPLWIVPAMSRLHQRAGDMVAGTIVVADAPAQLSPVRTALAARQAAEAQFRFDAGQLKKLAPSDFQAVERVLERWATLKLEDQAQLADTYTRQLAKKLGIAAPAEAEQLRFLEDLLAAEFRRQDRHLV